VRVLRVSRRHSAKARPAAGSTGSGSGQDSAVRGLKLKRSTLLDDRPAIRADARSESDSRRASAVRLWRAELLAYFDQPTTNGYAEGVINKVKVIKRRAYGLRSFDAFRERVLLACA
jgi:hypothetical protein